MLRRSVEIWTWKTRYAVSTQHPNNRSRGRTDMHHQTAEAEPSATDRAPNSLIPSTSATTEVKCRSNPRVPSKFRACVKSDIARDAVWTPLYKITRKWQPVHNVSVKRMTKSVHRDSWNSHVPKIARRLRFQAWLKHGARWRSDGGNLLPPWMEEATSGRVGDVQL